jgi:hypothetical protein
MPSGRSSTGALRFHGGDVDGFDFTALDMLLTVKGAARRGSEVRRQPGHFRQERKQDVKKESKKV